MRSWDHIVGPIDMQWALNRTHHGVDRRMYTESFLNDLGLECEALDIFMRGGTGVGPEDLDLLLVKLFLDVRSSSKAEDYPGCGRRRRVLASHEQCDHHVCDFHVRHRCAVLVDTRHQVPDHIFRILLPTSRTAFSDDTRVGLGHLLLGSVTPAVVGDRGPGKSEVDSSESHIQVVVELSEG